MAKAKRLENGEASSSTLSLTLALASYARTVVTGVIASLSSLSDSLSLFAKILQIHE